MLRILKKADPQSLREIEEEKSIRKTNEVFLLFLFGSQTDFLIEQAVARHGLFCLPADPTSVTVEDVRKINPIGIICTGGPYSVYDHESPPPFDYGIFDLGIPVLGICLGFQMWAKHVGAEVTPAPTKEYGGHAIRVCDAKAPLLTDMGESFLGWQSHSDMIRPSIALCVTAVSEKGMVAAGENGHLHGLQFHPEVSDTPLGDQLFQNFCFGICNARDCYPARDVAAEKITVLRESIGEKRVLLALSGGSDSSVVAHLLRHALSGAGTRGRERLRAIYIEGLDRLDDRRHLIRHFGNEPWLQLEIVNARDRFLAALRGKTDGPSKRAAMRQVYAFVLNEEAARFGAECIAQGTLYTDISESGGGYDAAVRKARIKQHHNVGLPLSVKEVSPLTNMVKDNARELGLEIGVPAELLTRHPFPGPGLSVRIEGEVTGDRLDLAQRIDDIWIVELRRAGFYGKIWQAGANLTNSWVTCTRGDESGSGQSVRLWAVTSVNGFTARPYHFPDTAFIEKVCVRIVGEFPQIGNVDYRYTPKPPATIEGE